MCGCLLVFAAAIVGETQRNVCRCKARIAFERFFVGRTRLMLPAFLIESQTLDIRLFSAGRNLRVRNGTRCRFEVGIAINRRIRPVFNKLAPIFAFEGYGKRLAQGRGGQINRSAECFRRIQLDAF